MVSSARARGAAPKTPRAMPPAPCSKRRRDNLLTRSNINCSFVRAGGGEIAAQAPALSAIPVFATILDLPGRRYARNRPNKHRSFMSDVVRLEYRNVTMRFAATGNRGVLTAVQGVSFSGRDGEVVSL